MTVRVINLEYDIYQGSYSELDLDYPNYVNGVHTPVDSVTFAGAVITCKFRKNASSPVVLSLTTADNSITITDAPTNKFKLKFLPATTSAMTEKGNVVYQGHVEVTLGGVIRRTHQILSPFSPEINV